MPNRRIWSAEELELMSPDERRDVVRSGFTNDLSSVSPDLIDRARHKIEDHIRSSKDTPVDP